MTETEIYFKIEEEFSKSRTSASFKTIVASGQHSSTRIMRAETEKF
jgi:Xaa-Pro aminopeptidase